jgi:hypothetical protein
MQARSEVPANGEDQGLSGEAGRHAGVAELPSSDSVDTPAAGAGSHWQPAGTPSTATVFTCAMPLRQALHCWHGLEGSFCTPPRRRVASLSPV